MGSPVGVLVVCANRLTLSKEYSMPSPTATEQMEEMAALAVPSSMSMPTTVASMSIVVLWAMPVIDEMSSPPFRMNVSA